MRHDLTEHDIREALRVCYDPELQVNIIDLGLVYSIQVRQDHEAPGINPRFHVTVIMTMRSPNDEREAMLVGQIKNRLAGMQELSGSTVEIVWEPTWTSDRMTAAARQQLGLDRQAKQGLVTINLTPNP